MMFTIGIVGVLLAGIVVGGTMTLLKCCWTRWNFFAQMEFGNFGKRF